ncbi:hypothetical protein Tco_0088347 [Tanacetum coccineum]
MLVIKRFSERKKVLKRERRLEKFVQRGRGIHGKVGGEGLVASTACEEDYKELVVMGEVGGVLSGGGDGGEEGRLNINEQEYSRRGLEYKRYKEDEFQWTDEEKDNTAVAGVDRDRDAEKEETGRIL